MMPDATPAAAPSAPASNETVSPSTSEANVQAPDVSALSAEEQDRQNIRNELGIDPITLEAVVDDDDAPAETAADSDDAPDASEPSDAAAADPSDTDAGDVVEITDAQLDVLLELVGEERLLKHPKLAERVIARTEVDQTIQQTLESRQQATTVADETKRLIDQGSAAMRGAYDDAVKAQETLKRASENLKKAAANEEFDPESVDLSAIDPGSIQQRFRDFGTALVLDTRRGYDNGFSSAVIAGRDAVAPFTEEEQKSIIGFVQTAQRIENDPNQGSDAAKSHLMVETVKFLVNRAKDTGRAEALAEVAARREKVKTAIGGDSAVSAAIAKLTKTREKLPAGPIAAPPSSESTGATMDEYDAAVKAGDYKLADEITSRMAQQKAAGQYIR